MRVARFKTKTGVVKYGIVSKDHLRVIIATPFEGMIIGTSEAYGFDEVTLLAPCEPSKIVAVGLNYKEHVKELGMELPDTPLLFMKPQSSVIGHGQEIIYPRQSNRVDYEAELGVVISQKATNIPEDKAHRYILGYTCVNDVTARDIQKIDGQFTRSKSFDTFCPFGPWIETELKPDNLKIECLVNGELKQSASTSDLIHSVTKLVSFISQHMTLEPGDLIATGTPKGIGELKPGDEVVVRIDGIGELKNTVRT